MVTNDDINAWLDQMKADSIDSLRAEYAGAAVSDDAAARDPQVQPGGLVSQSLNFKPLNAQDTPPVSFYVGEDGRGLVNDAARLQAARQNRINTNDLITYTAEQHGDPSLPKQWAVVGRSVAPPSDATADPQTSAPYTDEEAAQDLARETRRAQGRQGGTAYRSI